MYIQGTPAEIQTLAGSAIRRLCYRPAIFFHCYRLIALSSPQGKNAARAKIVVILISFYFLFSKLQVQNCVTLNCGRGSAFTDQSTVYSCRTVREDTRLLNMSLTLRLLMSYIYGAPILDVSRSHTTTQHSR